MDFNLKNLGHQKDHVLNGADASLLETINAVDLPIEGLHDLRINIVAEEFTCLCAVTSGPDAGKILIEYVPNEKIIESKSLKFYLESFRGERIFHEAVVLRILEDLVNAAYPKFIRVSGEFRPRGGIAISPSAQWKE